MEKLELKHLSPYLPYGLKFGNVNRLNKKPLELAALDGFIDGMFLGVEEKSKPILRPLSDLNKLLDLDNTKICPLRYCLSEDLPHKSGLQEDYLNGIENKVLKYKYEKIVKLFEWHFDVFGLIEKGLAIDINKL